MFEGIESVTTATLGLALDAATLRQQAIAANIANANSVGYVPRQVRFEDQLAEARRSLASNGSVDPYALAGVRLRMEAVSSAGGTAPAVRLDAEVSKMAENGVQYQALIKALNRHFAILNSAVSDGKR